MNKICTFFMHLLMTVFNGLTPVYSFPNPCLAGAHFCLIYVSCMIVHFLTLFIILVWKKGRIHTFALEIGKSQIFNAKGKSSSRLKSRERDSVVKA